MVRLGILEYFDQSDRRSLDEKRRRSLETARFADTHGCSRVLVAEHHGPLSPSASPVLFAAVIASHTSAIRVGTAVSLLRVRDTYLTAVDFSSLAGVAGDRVDVGLGRGDFGGPGSHRVEPALRKNDARLEDAFGELRRLLLEGCESMAPATHAPQFWMHGTSSGSAAVAARLGMHFCFGLFLKNDVDTAIEAVRRYRDSTDGTVALAVSMVANRDRRKALADAAGVRDVALNLVGEPGECADAVDRLIDMTGADELILAELSDDTDDHLEAVDYMTKSLS